MRNIDRCGLLFATALFAVSNWSCSNTTNPTSYTYEMRTYAIRWSDYCAMPVPDVDSAGFGAHGTDTGILFFFRGVTKAGVYQFGSHDGITVRGSTYASVSGNRESNGGSLTLTSFLNRPDSVSFDGSFDMIFIDTNASAHIIYTEHDTGSFQVHRICQ